MTAEVKLLPTATFTPQMILDQVRANYPKALSVVVSVIDEDEEIHACWSNMTTERLAYHIMHLQSRYLREEFS